MRMAQEIGSPDKAAAYVKAKRKQREAIMGFGHRVYRAEDPRGVVLREAAERLGGPLVDRAAAMEEEILAVLAEWKPDQRIVTSFDRGKPFSIFSGSPSRSILANLPTVHLQRIFLTHADQIAQANLGRTWPEFKEKMKAARDEGVVVASDIEKKLIGFGAPIFSSPGNVTASVTLARIKSEVDPEGIKYLSNLAIEVAERISSALQTYHA